MSGASKKYSTEILIVGGGLGGVSAALATIRLGRKVVLVEELDWLGGQLTAQGVPLDEHPWAESLVSSQSFAALRGGIRAWYRDHKPLTEAARPPAQSRHGQCRHALPRAGRGGARDRDHAGAGGCLRAADAAPPVSRHIMCSAGRQDRRR